MDLFVISGKKGGVSEVRRRFKAPRKISLKVVSPREFLSLKSSQPAFISNVSKGIILWRAGHE
ncbi:Uncharacterised protein [uncultured archaeon]|nr:Uncharacterised protein [uncultured archaeon]